VRVSAAVANASFFSCGVLEDQHEKPVVDRFGICHDRLPLLDE
jgi:hypothetical protein